MPVSYVRILQFATVLFLADSGVIEVVVRLYPILSVFLLHRQGFPSEDSLVLSNHKGHPRSWHPCNVQYSRDFDRYSEGFTRLYTGK